MSIIGETMDENNDLKSTENEVLKSIKNGVSKTTTSHYRINGNISYQQIVTIFISFILGIVVILFLQNAIKSEIITFSTVDIISFLFSVTLSGVSIFLAITAIILSRSTEKAIIERSDAGIKL